MSFECCELIKALYQCAWFCAVVMRLDGKRFAYLFYIHAVQLCAHYHHFAKCVSAKYVWHQSGSGVNTTHYQKKKKKRRQRGRERERENEAKGCEIAHTFRSMSSKVLLHKGIWQRKASSHNIQLPRFGMSCLLFIFVVYVYFVVVDYFFLFSTLARNKSIKITDSDEMCRAWICLCFFFSFFTSTFRNVYILICFSWFSSLFSFQILEIGWASLRITKDMCGLSEQWKREGKTLFMWER